MSMVVKAGDIVRVTSRSGTTLLEVTNVNPDKSVSGNIVGGALFDKGDRSGTFSSSQIGSTLPASQLQQAVSESRTERFARVGELKEEQTLSRLEQQNIQRIREGKQPLFFIGMDIPKGVRPPTVTPQAVPVGGASVLQSTLAGEGVAIIQPPTRQPTVTRAQFEPTFSTELAPGGIGFTETATGQPFIPIGETTGGGTFLQSIAERQRFDTAARQQAIRQRTISEVAAAPEMIIPQFFTGRDPLGLTTISRGIGGILTGESPEQIAKGIFDIRKEFATETVLRAEATPTLGRDFFGLGNLGSAAGQRVFVAGAQEGITPALIAGSFPIFAGLGTLGPIGKFTTKLGLGGLFGLQLGETIRKPTPTKIGGLALFGTGIAGPKVASKISRFFKAPKITGTRSEVEALTFPKTDISLVRVKTTSKIISRGQSIQKALGIDVQPRDVKSVGIFQARVTRRGRGEVLGEVFVAPKGKKDISTGIVADIVGKAKPTARGEELIVSTQRGFSFGLRKPGELTKAIQARTKTTKPSLVDFLITRRGIDIPSVGRARARTPIATEGLSKFLGTVVGPEKDILFARGVGVGRRLKFPKRRVARREELELIGVQPLRGKPFEGEIKRIQIGEKLDLTGARKLRGVPVGGLARIKITQPKPITFGRPLKPAKIKKTPFIFQKPKPTATDLFGESGQGLQLAFKPAVEVKPTGPLQNIFGTTDFTFPGKPRAAKPPRALRRTQFGIAGIEKVQESIVGAKLKLFVGGPSSVRLPIPATRTTPFPQENIFGTPPGRRGSGFDVIPSRFATPPGRQRFDTGIKLAQEQTARQDIGSKVAAGLIGKQIARDREDVLLRPRILETTRPIERDRTGIIQDIGIGEALRQDQKLGLRTRTGLRLRQVTTTPFIPDLGVPGEPPPVIIPLPDDDLFPRRVKKKKKKLPRRRFEPRFKPSLFGIEIGATIKKAPKFVGGAGVTGIRPIVIAPSAPRQPKRINRRSNLPKVMRNKSTMGFVRDTAVFLGGRQIPKIPTFGGGGPRRRKGRRRSMSSLL